MILEKLKKETGGIKIETPSNLEMPSFAMNFPFTFKVETPNNVWNMEAKKEDIEVSPKIAYSQFMDLYNYLASESIIQLVPNMNKSLQDLVFVANLGVILEHLIVENINVAITSNFTSSPRVEETEVGDKFFDQLGYYNYICPYKFEGSADLKWLFGNTYIGMEGQRSTKEAFDWMEENFDMKVIRVKQHNPKLYHLDCSVFPITKESTLVATSTYTKDEIKELEKYSELIHVPTKYAQAGVTNSVRCYNAIINASDIDDLDHILDKEDYRLERDKNIFFEDICSDFALELINVNLSEFMKGGALLSCLVLELNRFSYNFKTV